MGKKAARRTAPQIGPDPCQNAVAIKDRESQSERTREKARK